MQLFLALSCRVEKNDQFDARNQSDDIVAFFQ